MNFSPPNHPPQRLPSQPTTPSYLSSPKHAITQSTNKNHPKSTTNGGKTPSLSYKPMTPSPVPLAAHNHFSDTKPHQQPFYCSSLIATRQLKPQGIRSKPCFRVQNLVNTTNHHHSPNSKPFSSDTLSHHQPPCQCFIRPPVRLSPASCHQGTRTESKPCSRVQNIVDSNNHIHSQNSKRLSLDTTSRQLPLRQPLVQTKRQQLPKPRHVTLETRSKPCYRVQTVTDYNKHNHVRNSVPLSPNTQSHQQPFHQPVAPTLTWLLPKSHDQGTMPEHKPCFRSRNVANSNSNAFSKNFTNFSTDTASHQPPHQQTTSTNQTACILAQIHAQQQKLLAQQKAQIEVLTLQYSQQQARDAQREQDTTSTTILAEITLLCNEIIHKLNSHPTNPPLSISTASKAPEHPHYQQNLPNSTITAIASTKQRTVPTFMSILMEANSFATFNTPFSFSSSAQLTLIPWYPPCLSLLVWIVHVDRIFIRHRKEIHQGTTL